MSAKRPEDLIPDGIDTAIISGVKVRKGTVGAFLANLDVLESNASPEEKKQVLELMKELAPAIIAIGLHKHVVFKNPQAQKLLDDAAQAL